MHLEAISRNLALYSPSTVNIIVSRAINMGVEEANMPIFCSFITLKTLFKTRRTLQTQKTSQ